MASEIKATAKTRVRRLPKRANYDRDIINEILDEAFICHVGFVVDSQPYVIPTGFARLGGELYIHGSAASRMLRSLAGGIDVCVTVTIVDGLVMARSSFHHSMNYRSVVVLGRAELIDDHEEKNAALKALTEHMAPGRWDASRLPNELELKATSVLKLPITEASAKIRTGPPNDDEEDLALDFWAGIVPVTTTFGLPMADPKLRGDIDTPEHILNFQRPQKA